jgi:hypothetical protein
MLGALSLLHANWQQALAQCMNGSEWFGILSGIDPLHKSGQKERYKITVKE